MALECRPIDFVSYLKALSETATFGQPNAAPTLLIMVKLTAGQKRLKIATRVSTIAKEFWVFFKAEYFFARAV